MIEVVPDLLVPFSSNLSDSGAVNTRGYQLTRSLREIILWAWRILRYQFAAWLELMFRSGDSKVSRPVAPVPEWEEMMTAADLKQDGYRYYRHISIMILLSLASNCAMLVWLNSLAGQALALAYLDIKAAIGVQLFFWGALGATIASSLFLARDKDENELESARATPDLTCLRYPDKIDVHLYVHRILTSACLAVVGALFLYAGLSYFDVPADLPSPKHRAFFILFAFLIGLHQGNFVAFLHTRFQKILEKSDSDVAADLPKGKGEVSTRTGV